MSEADTQTHANNRLMKVSGSADAHNFVSANHFHENRVAQCDRKNKSAEAMVSAENMDHTRACKVKVSVDIDGRAHKHCVDHESKHHAQT